MNFYELWNCARNKKMNESSFILDFLSETDFSNEVIFNGNNEEVLLAIRILISTPMELFISYIDKSFNELSADTIVQFSTFEHAVFTINRLIHFEGKMTFSQIGRDIVGSKMDGANKKYGENHSKLAAILGLVRLSRESSFIVENTSLGEFSVSMSKEDKIQLVRRFATRNPFIQRIIAEAKTGNCDYMVLSRQFLSESTAIRRKSNVKYLIYLILSGTDFEYLTKNIVW